MIEKELRRVLQARLTADPNQRRYFRDRVQQIDPNDPLNADQTYAIHFAPREIAVLLAAAGDKIGVSYMDGERERMRIARSMVGKYDVTVAALLDKVGKPGTTFGSLDIDADPPETDYSGVVFDEIAAIELEKLLDRAFERGIKGIFSAIRGNNPHIDPRYEQRLSKLESQHLVMGPIRRDPPPITPSADIAGRIGEMMQPEEVAGVLKLSKGELAAAARREKSETPTDRNYRDSSALPIYVDDIVEADIDGVATPCKVLKREVRNYFGCLYVEPGNSYGPRWVKANTVRFVSSGGKE